MLGLAYGDLIIVRKNKRVHTNSKLSEEKQSLTSKDVSLPIWTKNDFFVNSLTGLIILLLIILYTVINERKITVK